MKIEQYISMSEFKKNPAKVMPLLRERTANGEKGGYTIVDVDSV